MARTTWNEFAQQDGFGGLDRHAAAPVPPCRVEPGFMGLPAVLLRAAQRAISWHDRACQRRQLASLDDRMLRDIGVGRFDALQEAAKPFWR